VGSKAIASYPSDKLIAETRALLDHCLKLINAEDLPEIIDTITRERRVSNPNFEMPEIHPFGYHTISEALFYDAKGKMPDLTIEECQRMVDKFLSNREVCHHVLTGLLLDIVGDLDQEFIGLVATKHGQEIASKFAGTMHTLKGDDGLYAVDESFGEGIANLIVKGAENWRAGDVGKVSVWAKIIDMAVKYCHVELDDIFIAIVSGCKEKLESERETASNAARDKRLYHLTRKLLARQLGKQGFTMKDLAEQVHVRQKKYCTQFELDLSIPVQAVEKVLSKRYACIIIVFMLLSHVLVGRLHVFHKLINASLGRFRFLKKTNRAYRDWTSLLGKGVYTISYPLMNPSAAFTVLLV
jgi:phosphatidylglycerophosphatase A